MYQVYISSTYRDLIEYREIAAAAARRLQCRAVVMEDYLASDERPLERCLADIRACNIYLGIFAWRYGFIPPGHDKSITCLEYEEAGRAGIPRLIFILDSTTDWPDQWCDTDENAIVALRSELEEKHLVSHFSSTDELDARLTAALSVELQKHGGSGKVEIPELLPYMNDRSQQSEQLAEALDMHLQRQPRRPFVAVVHGDEREAHSAFVKRLQQVTFPKLLGLPAEIGQVQHFPLRWSQPGQAVADRERRLHNRLAEAMTGERHAQIESLMQAVAAQRCPVMISTSILSIDWSSDEQKLVQQWLHYWAQWPDLPPGQHLIILLNFHLKDCSRLSFWKRRKAGKQNSSLCAWLNELNRNGFDNLTLLTLDRLEAVQEADVLSWLEEHAGKFCREARGVIRDPLVLAEQIRPRVRDLFSQMDTVDESGGIHMEFLARELRRELHRCLNEGGI